MSLKCSAPFCAIDNSGSVFRLFPQPSNPEICAEWQARMCLSSGVNGVVNLGDQIYLCEVHFDDCCWDCTSEDVTLKATALPSIFQHSCPFQYIFKLHEKLKSVNMCPDIGDQGIEAIVKLKSEDKLEDSRVRNELIEFSRLLAVSAMQKIRLNQKSDAIAAIKFENNAMTEEVNELLLDIKSMSGYEINN